MLQLLSMFTPQNLNRKKVLITGALGGLGTELVKGFLADGYQVVALAHTTPLANDEEAPSDPNITVLYMDLADQSADLDLVLTAHQDVDHIVLCHGKNFNSPILELTKANIDESMAINFYGALRVVQYYVKVWLAQSKQDASVTYISSVAAKTCSPDEVAYHAAKRAMESAIHSFAREFASKKLRFNVVSPGLMDTAMGKVTQQNRPDVISRIPMGELVKTKDVFILVKSLVETSSVTGQNFHINAGRYLGV